MLIVDFTDQIDSLEMTYNMSTVLNPIGYNQSMDRLIDKYKNPQKEMFTNDEEFVKEARIIHSNYEKESALTGIFDFKATVLKFERKTKSRQVKFFIQPHVAEYFLKSFDNIHRTVLVLNTME